MFETLPELMQAKGYQNKRAIPWNRVCEEEQLSPAFIRENSALVNWHLVSAHQELPETFIREWSGKLYWEPVVTWQKVSEQFIEEYADESKWLEETQGLSKRQLKTLEKEGRSFDGGVYWTIVSQKQELANGQGLSPAFIERHQDDLRWDLLSYSQKLPMSLIGRHAEKVDWNTITRRQVLSERFIEKYRSQVEWETISFHQELSERFINRYHAKMSFISAERKRSEAFLYTHLDKMDAASVIENQNIWNVKQYEPFDVYVIRKNNRKKYILKFHERPYPEAPDVHVAGEEELFEFLEENGLEAAIEEDFPELISDEEFGF